jgi:hypothetical protein
LNCEAFDSQFNLLHAAYRVTPYLLASAEESSSGNLVVRGGVLGPGLAYGELPVVPGDDELGVLLSFQLEQPISEWLDSGELAPFVPLSNPLWRIPQRLLRGGEGTGGPARPFCLLTLVDPAPAEREALGAVDIVALLGRLKSLSKQLRQRADHAVPGEFAQLLYTTINLIARVRHGQVLHTIGDAALAGNARWFLSRPWFDDRLRPLFEAGVALALGPGPGRDNPIEQ